METKWHFLNRTGEYNLQIWTMLTKMCVYNWPIVSSKASPGMLASVVVKEGRMTSDSSYYLGDFPTTFIHRAGMASWGTMRRCEAVFMVNSLWVACLLTVSMCVCVCVCVETAVVSTHRETVNHHLWHIHVYTCRCTQRHKCRQMSLCSSTATNTWPTQATTMQH